MTDRYSLAAAGLAKNVSRHYISTKTRCNVCGQRTPFVCLDGNEPLIRRCIWCRSTPKYRALVHVIESWSGIPLRRLIQTRKVYELSTTSPIHRLNRGHKNYTCSAYFSDQSFGQQLPNGAWNEDLQQLTFADGSFDLVISSETMEHVRRPWVAFAEIARVLRPGGAHCFTIPYRDDRTTTSRVDTSGEENVYLAPKVYHQDPHNPEDSLLYTDFGYDLPDILRRYGFETETHRVWNESADIRDDARPMAVFIP